MSERLLLKDVKKGQVFYECECGKNLKVTALEDARRVQTKTHDGYECCCEIEGKDDPTMYFQHITLTHYLKLYKSPQYLTLDMLPQKYSTLAAISSTLDRLLDKYFDTADTKRRTDFVESDLGEIEYKGEKVMVKIKVVRGK